MTFGQLCNRYVEHRRTTPSGKHHRTAQPNTLRNWRGMLDNYILPAIGDVPPQDLTSEDFLRVLYAASRVAVVPV